MRSRRGRSSCWRSWGGTMRLFLPMNAVEVRFDYEFKSRQQPSTLDRLLARIGLRFARTREDLKRACLAIDKPNLLDASLEIFTQLPLHFAGRVALTQDLN